MHGSITANNRTDRPGAVFTMRLPVFAEAERAAEIASLLVSRNRLVMLALLAR